MSDEKTEEMLKRIRSNFPEEVGSDPEPVIEEIRRFLQDQRWRGKGQQEETRVQSTDERGEANGSEEVRTGRGNAGLVRGEDERCRGNEASGKGKGKGHEGKGEHGKEEGRGGKGARQKMPSEEDEEDETVQVAPNSGAGGSHPWATTDPEEEEEGRKEKGEEAEEQQCGGGKRSNAGEWTLRPAREWQKWVDCVDEEPEEEAGEEDEQEAEDECEEKEG